MRPKAVTLIVRMWQAQDGTIKASIKGAEGGQTRHFPDLQALLHYLEGAREQGFWVKPSEPSGLR
ncbi:MAG: hypothetical protein C4332_01435 [Meiothermus sp.]